MTNELITHQPDIWTKEDELILKDWADKAICYKWLHTQSHKKFSKRYARYTIPVIIISTITGTANFAQDRVPEQYRSMAVMLIGALNILAGIVTTISQYLKLSALTESHRVAYISCDKFYRTLKIELIKRPEFRRSALEVMSYAKEEYDRLMDTSPDIPNDIISSFNTKFKKNNVFISANDILKLIDITNGTTIDKEDLKERIKSKYNSDYNRLVMPDICDSLTSTKIYIKDENEETDIFEKYKKEFLQQNGRQPTQVELERIVITQRSLN
jgi:hypothetical protein